MLVCMAIRYLQSYVNTLYYKKNGSAAADEAGKVSEKVEHSIDPCTTYTNSNKIVVRTMIFDIDELNTPNWTNLLLLPTFIHSSWHIAPQ